MNYSVLMSVYIKEYPEYLKESITSMLLQTVPSDDIVIVCDGPLTDELNQVLDKFKAKYQDTINIIRLKENVGLGKALNIGLRHCRNQLVARMDSDDISMENRCENQLKVFKQQEVDIVGTSVLEFDGTVTNIISKKSTPNSHKEISSYSKKRNPFNHPSVMFKKDTVMAAGGYKPFPYFEDYYLWIRMLEYGAKAYNIEEPLLYMRTGDAMYARRGGLQYAKCIWNFKWNLKKRKYTTWREFIISTIPHIVVSIIPNRVRKGIYHKMLRRK